MPAVPAAYPPNLLQPDPLALTGRTDVKGNGPLEIVQTNPLTGDTVIRNANGSWVNAPEEPSVVALLANLRQEGETGRPARTNLDGLLGTGTIKEETAALVTKEANLVAIPVAIGDVISKIGVLVGAQAAVTPTHSFGALCVGEGTEPAVIEQSADELTAAIAAEKLFAWKLAKAVTVTAAMAPKGYLSAAVSVTAGTVPGLMGFAGLAVLNKVVASVTGAPAASAQMFSVSGTEGVAKNPTGTLTATLKVPVVILF
jgi:hypothetical protein